MKRCSRAPTTCGAEVSHSCSTKFVTQQEKARESVTNQHAEQQGACSDDKHGEDGGGGPPRVRQRLRCAVQNKP
jgi:hypothetical protein